MRKVIAVLLLALAGPAHAATAGGEALAVGRAVASAVEAGAGSGAPLSLSLQLLLLMSVLTLLPSVLLLMTSFTRILIVLSILRQALGLQQTPPNQLLVGLALFLSAFVMKPVIDDIAANAVAPARAGAISTEQGVAVAGASLHRFMMAQTREKDLKLFADLAEAAPFARAEDVPFTILLPAFVTSELKSAFMIGFLIFLPFLVIDLMVSATLMALGMMMLSPTLVSLPFKLLLFVLVDGWALVMGSLASSFVL